MFPTLLSLCEENHRSPVDSPHEESVMRGFDVSFVVSLNKLLPVILDAMTLMSL